MVRNQAPAQPPKAPKPASALRVKLFNTVADLILGKNPSPEKANKAFHEALCWAPLETIQKVRKQPHVDVNRPDNMGLTPLHIAAGHTPVERTAVLDYLIQEGANVEEGHRVNGVNALFKAAYTSRWDSVKTLMAHGADINHYVPRHSLGNTLLTQMTKNRGLKHVENVLKLGADPNIANEDGNRALHQAALQGHTDKIKVLLKYKAEINAAGRNGNTPLMSAALSNQTDAVRLLLKKGANPHIANQKGANPLEAAKAHENPELIALLENAEQQVKP
jgi:ankyrin repeat protein